MKKINLAVLAGIGLVLAGCIVPSVYPFYTEKDLTTDDHLVGSWISTNNADRKEIWTFEKKTGKEYKFLMKAEDETNAFSTHLFKLSGELFMDCQMIINAGATIPPHYLLKVEQFDPRLKLSTLNLDWVTDYAKENPGQLRHTFVYDEPDDTNTLHIVLTGETAELQSFIKAHVSDTNTWTEMHEMKRTEAK